MIAAIIPAQPACRTCSQCLCHISQRRLSTHHPCSAHNKASLPDTPPLTRHSCTQRISTAGGGFGGPIRSRLVGDGSLPEELPPARSVDLLGPPRGSSEGMDIRRSSSWRPPPESSGLTPPGDRWSGPTTPVSSMHVWFAPCVDLLSCLLLQIIAVSCARLACSLPCCCSTSVCV